MSLSRIKSGIAARQAKIRQMKFEFEPDLKINQYREISLKILKEDYIAEVEQVQNAYRARQEAIITSHKAHLPTLTERHQRLGITQIEMRALSTAQLRKRAQQLRDLPPVLIDAPESWAIAAELRNRGEKDAVDEADSLSAWCESMHVGEPWVHDPAYQDLDRKIEKMGALAGQAETGAMFVFTDDPDKVSRDDIVMIAELDKEVQS